MRDRFLVLPLLDVEQLNEVAENQQHYSLNDDGGAKVAASLVCRHGHLVVLKCQASCDPQQP